MRRRRLDRFGRLEAARRPGGAAPPAAGSSRLEARFRSGPKAATGDADAPPPVGSQRRSGGQPARFETPAAEEPPLRVLDVENSQPFVRCAECYGDGHATSVRCQHCGSDLTTREQRAFNETLWKRRLQEKADEDREVGRLRAAREEADREMAEAFRLRATLEQDLERRMALGLRLEIGDQEVNPLREPGRRAGRAIGGWLRRTFPNRSGRIVFLCSLGALAAVLVAVSPVARWLFYGGIVLALLASFASLELRGGRR